MLTKLQSGNNDREESPDLMFNRIGSDSLQPSTSAKLLIALTVTMLVANLIAPDSVFAKGSTSYYGSSGDDTGLSWGFTGMMLTGVVWLANLNGDSISK